MDVSDHAAEFVTQHSQRLAAEAEERRLEDDAFSKHYEDFVQPWNGAWNLLGSAVARVYSKPGDSGTTNALVDAIRRIVELAKGTDYEKRIRVATERCQRLARKDPTGKAFQLANIADTAAILTILQACLDGSAPIEQLAAELRVTSPHRSESCRTNVECAGQMVTLQAGTPKQTAAAKVQTANLVRDSLTHCRERLVSAAEKHRALAVMLVHRSLLGNKPQPPWPENEENQAHHQLNLRGGPRCDIRQLFDTNGQPAIGDKPFLDVEGRPMLYSDGTPAALYPGAERTYSLYGMMFRGSDEASYSEAVAEYSNAATELGRLLEDLPQAIGQTLWQDWPHGFSTPKPADLWTNAVFELALQERPASRLNAERWAWHENRKLKIADLPTMRTSDSPVLGMFAELIDRVGDPPAFWYSWIANIGRASISAIDLLLTLLPSKKPASKTSSTRRPAVVDARGREAALDSPSAAFWETYPLKSYEEIYPDFLSGTTSSDPFVLEQLGNPPPYPTCTPDEDELAIVRTHFPHTDPANPPWKDIQARLIAAGLSLDSLKQLRSGDLVRVLAEKSTTNSADVDGNRETSNQANVESKPPPAASLVVQPAVGDGVADDAEAEHPAGLDSLDPAHKKAWASWKLAEANYDEKPQDQQAYDWLSEQDDGIFFGDLVGYKLPAPDTWKRYVREARKATSENKHLPRAGRSAGASVVKQSEI